MVAGLNVLNNREGTHGAAGFSPSGCNPQGRCGNGLEKIYPTCAVRYGFMRYIGEFRYSPGMLFSCGAKVVVQTNRGIELGEQVSLTCTGCDKSIDRRQILDYARQSGPEFLHLKNGRILRVANVQDLDEERHLNEDAARKLVQARERARNLGLPMKFVTCEHLLGGERIIFHFMAEGRVDFRALVRQLAQEYHTRIEMHQVGARDEARLVADYEICGRECCCKNFLKKLRQVNMKMAKLQKATLDPSKVSGRCGRLRCCLRYEHEGYEDLNKKLPRVGARVRTEKGAATVKDRQILTQLLIVEYDDSEVREAVAIEQLLEGEVPPRPPRAPVRSNRAGEAAGASARSGRPDSRRGRSSRPGARAAEPGAAPRARRDDSRPAAGDEASDKAATDAAGAAGVGPASGERRKRRRRRRARGNRGGRPDGVPGERGGGSGAPPGPSEASADDAPETSV